MKSPDRGVRRVPIKGEALGALHTRLVKGFVKDTRVEGSSRIVMHAPIDAMVDTGIAAMRQTLEDSLRSSM